MGKRSSGRRGGSGGKTRPDTTTQPGTDPISGPDARPETKTAAQGGTRKASGRRKPAEFRAPTAFDLWLERELKDMFSDVAQEPIPEELMRLIDEAKPRSK